MSDRIRELYSDPRPAVSFALREITHICRNMKKRAPGSEGEREAAAYMAESLEKDCGCTDVRIETFREHPASFYSYFYFSAAFDTLCAVTFFFLPWLSILFGCSALLLFLFHFVLYRKPIDRFFPEKESVVPLFGGSTDSAAFTQGGFRSVGITGLSHALEDYYHTRRDSFGNLNGEGLENCIKATAKLIEMLEE